MFYLIYVLLLLFMFGFSCAVSFVFYLVWFPLSLCMLGFAVVLYLVRFPNVFYAKCEMRFSWLFEFI